MQEWVRGLGADGDERPQRAVLKECDHGLRGEAYAAMGAGCAESLYVRCAVDIDVAGSCVGVVLVYAIEREDAGEDGIAVGERGAFGGCAHRAGEGEARAKAAVRRGALSVACGDAKAARGGLSRVGLCAYACESRGDAGLP